MFDERNRYVITDYSSKAPFFSFLPGIAGELGIPLWCYYCNRGQAVSSFGVQDKDHAIMEFSPAHVGYRDVSRTGFRTFCKTDGKTMELFTEQSDMHIGMGELEIRCRQNELSASVIYFGIPEERTGALGRILCIENTSEKPVQLEVLDGMSAVVPYGLNQDFLKNMTQLAKAWMQCEDHEEGLSYFRVRASLEDGAVVRQVKGGNYVMGFDDAGHRLNPIVQPRIIFGQDTSLSMPSTFTDTPLSELVHKKQITSNQVLCCFLPCYKTLQPGEKLSIYSIWGQAEQKSTVHELADKILDTTWFDGKRSRMNSIIQEITDPINCKTGDPVFDAYARQTYLDNLLRGGMPTFFRDGNQVTPFHLYSRKHGDPEREYNYFSLGREYYAQGNGNYRDVNQNRRCDVLFAPEIGDYDICTFFDLIQADGYNPLVILPSTYTLSEDYQTIVTENYPEISHIISKSFTPGQLAMALEDAGASAEEIKIITAKIINHSHWEPNANFGEGYWSDHWTYNLDLIEAYLSVYPENKDLLLFEEQRCRWYNPQAFINPRIFRYCETENGIRQYNALNEHKNNAGLKWMTDKNGNEVHSTIIEKLILLCAIKTATLDPEGMGIEMEGGRPGWYDALNGLPGIFGSSMAETCELYRLLNFTANAIRDHKEPLFLYMEVAQLADDVRSCLETYDIPFQRWDQLNTLKEKYRDQTADGFSGDMIACASESIISALRVMMEAVKSGIDKAKERSNGILPTYFTYTMAECSEIFNSIEALAFVCSPLPLFLEGPVHYLRLPVDMQEKETLVHLVKSSGLYDRKLRMYKVNESLAGVSYEAGRALAFTPGWLENESVWLHMEYKYLLELLKNRMYTQFSEAFRNAAVPFLNPDIYGRSPLENVSFIASSANPDPDIHGQGFVARLSGSTAEFIHMWQIMFFGNKPFQYQDDKLTLGFEPFIPEYLMPQDGIIQTTFLGHVKVTYHTDNLKCILPSITKPARYDLTYKDGTARSVFQTRIPQEQALAVREGKISCIDVYFS